MHADAGAADGDGGPDGEGVRVAVLAARFNGAVVERLLEGCTAALHRHRVRDADVRVAWVPGAFELPLSAKAAAASGGFDAVVCLGAVIRGETSHFDYVAGECARGLQDVALETGVPVLFGVLTTDTASQAMDRAGGAHGNKGWDAAVAALEMVKVLDELRGRAVTPELGAKG